MIAYFPPYCQNSGTANRSGGYQPVNPDVKTPQKAANPYGTTCNHLPLAGTDEGRTPILRPCEMSGLERLATRALMMLSDNANRVSDRLNNQATPEKAGQP